MRKVSAFIITLNEEHNLSDCLQSISFCDEVIVVDSGSTDRTVEIAKEFGAKVVFNKFEGYVEQKRFGLTQVSNGWVLNVDADERVDDTLRESIQKVLADPRPQVEPCYLVNRVVYFLGRWWRNGGWYPEYRLRFFHKDSVRWGGKNPHEKVIPHGKELKLNGELQHFTYDSIGEQVATLSKFARLSAEQDYASGKSFSAMKLILSPLARFTKFFFIKKGFLEGTAGFVVALNEAYYSFLKAAFLWEKHFKNK